MELVGYIATVIVLIFICGFALAALPSFLSRKKKPTILASTAIPEIGEGFDIGRRYDVVYSTGDYFSKGVERLAGVKIVGYVGKDDDETVGKMYMRSRWLVVEHTDGRRAYLMPHAIISLQESAEQ